MADTKTKPRNAGKLREAALASNLDQPKPTSVPELGFEDGEVFIASLSAQDVDLYEEGRLDLKTGTRTLKDARASLVALALVDSGGTRLFGAGDVETLSKKKGGGKLLSRLFGEAAEHNGLRGDEDDDEEEAGND